MSLLHDDFDYTDDAHAQYLERGYLIFDRFLSAEGLAYCQAQIDRMLDNLQPGRDPADIYSAHQQEQWMWDLATEPKVVALLQKQVGPDVVLWSSHMICKPPGTGIEIPWHQDAPYWNATGPYTAGLWIGFDDMDEDNGAMSVLAGWHKRGTLPRRDTGVVDGFTEEIDPNALPDDIDAVKAQYRFPAGGLAIHDTMIPHNSYPNRSDRWRRVLVLRYMAASGSFEDKTYPDYRTGEPFPRTGFLVGGHDTENHGWQQSPFQVA